MPGETILLVDDEAIAREGLQMTFADEGYRLFTASSAVEALNLMQAQPFDLVLTDLRMPGVDGLEFLRRTRELYPETLVILITGYATIESAIAAMKEGAFDYLTKPYNLEAVRMTVRRAASQKRLQQENRALKRELADVRAPSPILGRSRRMAEILDLVEQVAGSRSSVLITGESGTGKELVARALHYSSPRAERRFVSLNCSSFAETLLENELFGHEPGAFTDAKERKPGLFETADGGTIFLDEVGDLPQSMQPKLLRVLQEREVLRLGGTQPIPVDFRLVAATNRDLEAAVTAGRFRQDLFYRLNVISIAMPPLRDRPEDVSELAGHFLQQFCRQERKAIRGILPAALELLERYAWPGNVRQLENVLERAVILNRSGTIGPEDLPPEVSARAAAGEEVRDLVPLDEHEKRYILRVLEAVGNNRSKAARILGLDRSSLWRKLKEYGVPGGE
ncbi:MAG: sigma-54-dependent Fis family transcriptional regulator [Candidatus Riflebacteria bacterium]|nr:sigma-54-dependent Fis family transcriptional regulator [Candidatus Riflebacteria bacterium]